MTEYVQIFDTTLRDGEQAPGFSMREEGKMMMAQALADLNVDIIEAGFPAASPGDFRAVERIAQEIHGPRICALARAIPGDIERAGAAIQSAPKRRLHVFLGTSPLHREAKLNMTPGEILARIRDMVGYAREFSDNVEFSAEDAFRTEPEFLVEALSTAAAAGAAVLNVPDTVGYATPDEVFARFSMLIAEVERAPEVIFSTHCHNDLGMAVANSLAAVRAGVRQIECTLTGIGERAGNCALEDVVMAMRTRKDIFNLQTGIEARHLIAASHTLAQVTSTPVPRNKSIVGANAFAHESGIHQHGVLKNRETYEIMRPEDVGVDKSAIILGKHSGKHALKAQAADLGWNLEGERLDEVFAAFKLMADEIGLIDQARLCALLSQMEKGESFEPQWTLGAMALNTSGEAGSQTLAHIEMIHKADGAVSGTARASGALDSILSAINIARGIEARVSAIDMHYIAMDPEPVASDPQRADVLVDIEIEAFGGLYQGRARARDIMPACVNAYLDALSNGEAVAARKTQTMTSAA
ncbi:2-isopropylmalate synthase [Woodsholea maritima]|uniref:2-isopropylmalate synthase n=1 Tax=Woodsholea maritima TaxID=240237 RepID=UPI00036C7549|nr:2-isopropylmalate synthase [Woodsholea maritima]